MSTFFIHRAQTHSVHREFWITVGVDVSIALEFGYARKLEFYWSKGKRCNEYIRKCAWKSQRDNRCKYNLAAFHGAFNVSQAYKMDTVCRCSYISVTAKFYVACKQSIENGKWGLRISKVPQNFLSDFCLDFPRLLCKNLNLFNL